MGESSTPTPKGKDKGLGKFFSTRIRRFPVIRGRRPNTGSDTANLPKQQDKLSPSLPIKEYAWVPRGREFVGRFVRGCSSLLSRAKHAKFLKHTSPQVQAEVPEPLERDQFQSRFDATKSFFKHINGLVRVFALALGLGALNWSWQMSGEDEYLLSFVLLGLFAVFSSASLYGWEGVRQHPTGTRVLKVVLGCLILVVAAGSMAKFWQKKGGKPWTTLWSQR